MSNKQYVVFKLSNESYAVDIMNVSEITEPKKNTKVPNAPDFVDGIINLRGEVIPIIDLKKRFDIVLKDNNTYKDKRIIVVNMDDKKIGFIVDTASEVLTINENDIDPPSNIIAGDDRQFITGIGKVEERILIILDLEKILSEEQKQELEKI